MDTVKIAVKQFVGYKSVYIHGKMLYNVHLIASWFSLSHRCGDGMCVHIWSSLELWRGCRDHSQPDYICLNRRKWEFCFFQRNILYIS